MEKRELLVKGKAKSMYATDDPNYVVMHFRDDTSAFDGKKVEQLDRKGKVNNLFNAFIMETLAAAGVPTHFVKRIDDRDSLVRRMTMIPVECVVRNIAAGSLCRRRRQSRPSVGRDLRQRHDRKRRCLCRAPARQGRCRGL